MAFAATLSAWTDELIDSIVTQVCIRERTQLQFKTEERILTDTDRAIKKDGRSHSKILACRSFVTTISCAPISSMLNVS